MPRCRPRKNVSLTLALVGVLLAAPAHAQEEVATQSRAEYYASATFDAIVLRPLGLTATALGFLFFIPAAALTLPGGRASVEEAWDRFVKEPAEGVFFRPLGDF